ncbi:MAG: helix-turn-helix transcriptional regulator [Clostridia bacterium]|nr:helix-turn-helix transcriptional regulator [Clostridia bacterium]
MNKSLDLIITENLKKEIEQSGLKKSEIASAIGVSKATVSQYLSGRAQPTLATFSKLCTVLDCSADDILNIGK